MTIITWPSGLRVLGMNWHLAVSSGTPGRGLAGHQQIIRRENRFWQCDLALGVVDFAQVGIWQAFVDDLCGMANRIRLPVCNPFPAFPAGSANPVAVGAVSAGATILNLSGPLVGQIRVGMFCSHNDYLYRVADAAGGAVRINPPLRGGIADGAAVNVLTPRIVCRLASDEAGRLALDRMHRGEPVTVPLVEAFDR